MGCGVGRYIAYEQYLHHGRPTVGLAPTLEWEACLNFVATCTASVPVLLHVLKELGTVHLLTTSHSRSERGSSYPLSSLASRRGGRVEPDAAGGVHPSPDAMTKDARVRDVELGERQPPSSSGATASLGGRRSSYGSEVGILR